MINCIDGVSRDPPIALSQLEIDVDKDWAAKKIENLGAPDSGDDAKRHDSAPTGHHVSHEPGGADEVTGVAPGAHKDSHDPIDGSDKLDSAAPVKVGAANAIGTSHSFARADHVHEREHAKYTDSEAQTTVKANVEVGDLKAPTKPLAMNSQKITGLAAPGVGGDGLRYDELGLANGIATLDATVLVPEAQIPHTFANAMTFNGGIGADLNMNDHGLNNLHNINGKAGTNFLFFMGDDAHYISISSGSGLYYGGNLALYGKTAAPAGGIRLRTPNAAWNAAIARLELGGGLDVVDGTWTGVLHSGLKLKDALDANLQDLVTANLNKTKVTVDVKGTPEEGDLKWDDTGHKLQVYSGTAWETVESV